MITEAEWWLIGIALIATISSISFGIWSNLNTKKSNNLLEDQLYTTTRPWVSISELNPYEIKTQDDKLIDYFEFKKLPKEQQKELHPIESGFMCYIENIGLQSINMTVSANMGTGEITKENAKEFEIIEETGVLLPKQKIQKLIPVPYNLIRNRNKEPVFVILRINYQFEYTENELKKESITRIWKMFDKGIKTTEYFR